MARLSRADRMKRTEERLLYEMDQLEAGRERLEGIQNEMIISIRNSYTMTKGKVEFYLGKLRREMEQEGVR